MKKKIMLLILGLIGFSFADLQVGDTINYYMNIYRLIMERDTLPRKGVVRYVGKNFYLISGDRVAVTKIVRRNHSSYPDSFVYIASTVRTAGKDPQYLYLTTDLIKWKQNRSLSGADVGVDQDTTPTGDLVNTYDLDVYDIAPNPSPNAVTSYSSVYIASRDGLFGVNQAMASAAWIAMPDTAVFSVVFHPDSTGPIGPGNVSAHEILFIGTATGVYHVDVDIFDFAQIKQLADYNRMGNLTDTVFAVGVDPNNAKILYAGTGNKLYRWDSTSASWQSVLTLTGKARRIKFFTSQTIVVTTADGFWYTTDGGNTWAQRLSGKDVWDIEFAYGYYWAATAGDGVFRSASLDNTTWEEVNEGIEALAAVGAKLCYTIFYDPEQDVLLLGNEQGVWIWRTADNKWENVSKGIGSIIPETEVTTLAQAIENPFGNGVNLFDSLKTVLQVTDEELWDIDNDPHIYIVLSGLAVSTNLQDPTLTPIYGYFDPYDEDPTNPYSNGREMFVVDVGNFYDFEGNIDVKYLARYIGYLFNLYACWSLDRNESPALRTGLAIDALYLAGFNVFGDTVAIIGGRAWGNSKDRINVPLLSYTTAWLNAPVAREMDRERVGYFIEYLRERFGNQIFYDILKDKETDYYEVLEKHIEARGYTFDEVFVDWTIANLIDNPSIGDGRYGYTEIDNIFDYNYPDQFSSLIPDSALRHFSISPVAVVYLRENDSLVYHFDLADNFGDTLHGFRLYRILLGTDTTVTQLTFDTLYEFTVVGNDTIEILKRARNVISDTVVGNVRYVLINTSQSLTGYYSCSYEEIPPQVYSVYILQNPVVSHSLDFYVFSKEYLYGDANTASLPSVYVVPLNKEMTKGEAVLEYIEKGDTTYVFQASLTLSSDIEGDLIVYSYAQDLAGLSTILYYDTIGVRKISGGGFYTFLNGKVSIEIPAHMDYHNLVVVSRVKGMKDEYTVGSVYSVGGPGIRFPEEVKLVFKSPLFAGRKDVALYRYDGGKWVECRSYVNPETGEVIAYVDRLGIFAVKTGNPVPLPTKFSFALKSSNVLPFSHGISLQFALPCKSNVSLSIFDISGRKVYSRKLKSLSAGFYNYKIKPDIAKGVYIMKFKAVSAEKEYSRSLKLILF